MGASAGSPRPLDSLPSGDPDDDEADRRSDPSRLAAPVSPGGWQDNLPDTLQVSDDEDFELKEFWEDVVPEADMQFRPDINLHHKCCSKCCL